MSELVDKVVKAIAAAIRESDAYVDEGDSGTIIDGTVNLETIASAAIEEVRRHYKTGPHDQDLRPTPN